LPAPGWPPALLPLAHSASRPGAYLFRTVSHLGIRYRHSPLSVNGPGAPRRGPHAGDRLPDAPILHNGAPSTVHAVLAAPGWHLLLCGPTTPLAGDLDPLQTRHRALAVQHLSTHTGPGVLHDPDGRALHRLGVQPINVATWLIRPDRQIGYRAGTPDPDALTRYLDRWIPQLDR